MAFLLLAAMPVGMATPLLAEISGGRQSLALVLAVVTSLLAPFTIPLVVKFILGAAIEVSFWDMFVLLAVVVYVPFILAQIFKHFWQNAINNISGIFTPVATIFLGLIIMGAVAKQAEVIIEGLNNGGEFLFYLGALFIFFILLHLIGYYFVFWRETRDRITITVCLTYMNFILAIELVNEFFTEPNVVVPVVFAVIPWAVLLIPFKYIVCKFKKG